MTKPINFRNLQKSIKGKSLNATCKIILGEQIGKGLYRDVYVFKQNPDYVVKFERDPSTAQFCNVTEWRNYINNKEYKLLEEWLAPCELINETGQLLFQRRVIHKKRKDYPKYIPAIFTDTKLSNFGWIDDRFVCCDYAYLKPFDFKKKMQYAKWFK